MQPGNIAIIGGTGFEVLPSEIYAETLDVATRRGNARVLSVSDNYTEPHKLYFLSRHGAEHGLAPHNINYGANILALKELEVRYVFATNAVGALRADLIPGTFVIMDDFVDFTKHREPTLFTESLWHHSDFSAPYSPLLRELLIDAVRIAEAPCAVKGTYVCCDGPRFESPAEVRLFRQWGGDVVGMTGLPEAIFAREAGLEYAAVGIVTNLGAGLTDLPVSHSDVVLQMASRLPLLREICVSAARQLARLWEG